MAAGTKDDPWILKTPPGTSEYSMYNDSAADPPALGVPGRLHYPQVPPAGN